MRISTNSGLHSARVGKERYSMVESVRFCAEAGFEALDINFCAAIYVEADRIDRTILGDDWREQLDRIMEEARRHRLAFPTAHLPFYNYNCEAPDNEFRNRMFGRAIEACAAVGVQWAVVHPHNAPGDDPDFSHAKKKAVEHLGPFLEQARSLGVGFAVENMFPATRYCADAERLCDLVDALGPGAGVCWDFGHAHLAGVDQAEALRKVGSRLKMLHVHDNRGVKDDHAAPYMGTIEWESLMPVLHEIGFAGDFNYEVQATRIPEELRRRHADYLVAAARYLVSLSG